MFCSIMLATGLLIYSPATVAMAAGNGCAPVIMPHPAICASAAADSMISPHTLQKADSIIRAFMAQYQVPGMAVAITRKGKLVYARGFGTADRSTGEQVTAESRFRIASVSKTITAVAILKLVEAQKLSLGDKVFGPGGLLGTTYGSKPYSSRLQAITVQHLLQHTAGGWSNNANDPMFSHPEWPADTLLAHTIDQQPLENDPGAVYAYSNFGYCVLGRIIERVTGKSYAAYVQEAVLQPAGIRHMEIGGNTLADRKPGEVVYYGQLGQRPYSFNLSRMDAHGGWIASATGLARFLTVVDGFSSRPDILSPATVKAMTTGSEANAGYALGWAVNAWNNWWHAGSLPGTASEIVRAANGFNWVILCNTRTDKSFFNDLDGLVWKVVNDRQLVWPDVDLFMQ
ncbi:CubicO group peptidase, beta-lactamase class C family [Chitinophaga eiseniae]|uniref:CubicO group peptidase, beta-lactamase class C family n=1 Tax=Chitinophaga eiseniae TaxID=634771 RepID=A0A1T4QPV8_9BACT|nr:serine hydrolase domain-containing protein [Chitinophaga eiseniae]SKA05793.1 CubicO group peptidase, beta-lactamase class C family [Chitinophaga eiseniae]